MTSAISVKDRLKNQAALSGKSIQEALIAYGLERTVYRLSISEYRERFTLKGGIFLYALFNGEFARVTRDIDLLAKNMSNSAEDILWDRKIIFPPTADFRQFELGNLTNMPIQT